MLHSRTANVARLQGYLGVMTAIVLVLRGYRESALTRFSTDAATKNWEDWRAAADELGRQGSVEREAPKSVEPPALVLMRDHYPACLGISLLLSSCLYAWFMFCVRGAFRPVELNVEQDE